MFSRKLQMTSRPSCRLILVTSLVPGVEPEAAQGRQEKDPKGRELWAQS